MTKKIKIEAFEKSTLEVIEIDDLYWFEENFVHWFDDDRFVFELTHKDKCKWMEDAIGGEWEVDCGYMFQFNDGGPKDNGFKYCPNCGKEVEEIEFVESEDED